MQAKTKAGLNPKVFLQKYWQKKPLLIKQAFPGFGDLLNKKQLMTLACNPETESRLVQQLEKKWTVQHGPFKQNSFSRLSGKWTLLVQGVNYFLSEANSLLQQFNFIPYARLDDLMVSYAVDGGGVGPHFDSYDVFLLQGHGKRLWQISNQKDHELIPNAPLRILKNFNPEKEWVLEPGDMLYLPPAYAHHGIAMGECMTYSIGFRAPAYQELMNEFLQFIHENLVLNGRYEDPDLKLTNTPALISNVMVNKIFAQLKKIRTEKKMVEQFLGNYLSEPKAHLQFDVATRPLTLEKFSKADKIFLNSKTQMLYLKDSVFINGESLKVTKTLAPLIQLADRRELQMSATFNKQLMKLLYDWYLCGWVQIK